MSNIAAEKIFLSCIAQNPTQLFDFVEYLGEEDFQHAATRMTFESLRSLIVDKETDKVTKAKIVAEAKSLGHSNYLSCTKNGEWVDELFTESVTPHETANHFMEVKRQTMKSVYNESFSKLRDYLSTTSDPLSIIISNVENEIIGKLNVMDRGEHAVEDMREGFKEYLETLADDPGQMGIDLGYPLWQERVGQIRNGTIVFVAATTKAGKSQFGLSCAAKAAMKGLPVLICDSELNKHDQWIRLAAIITQTPTQYIETGFWKMTSKQLHDFGVSSEKIDHILECGKRMRDPRVWERIEKMPIYYQSISGMDVSDVIPHMRRWILSRVKPDRETRVPQCLIVYDYIKLAMTDEIKSGRLQEYQLHGLNVAALHDFARKYNVPMLAFGQTNNEIDDDLRCIAGAKRISENVGSITLWKRKGDRELAQDPCGSHMVKVFAARYGAGLPGGYINFDADLSCGQFKELDVGNVRKPQKEDDDYDDDDE